MTGHRANPDAAADFVVVGAGASGCVLASRLAAAGASVLLVEGGHRSRHPLRRVPKGFVATLSSSRLTRVEMTQPDVPEQAEAWIRGRGPGGSTTINGSIWDPGPAFLHDALGDLMGPGWDAGAWARGAAAVEEAAARAGLRVTDDELDPVGRDLLTALAALGVEAGPTRATVDRGRKWNAADAFLGARHGGARHGGPRLVAGCEVDRVVLEAGRAVGVVARRGARDLFLRARSEVILSAGALGSSVLLERSGIGDPNVLTRAGLPCVVPLPPVGTNLREHRSVIVKARLRPGLGLHRRLRSRRHLAIEAVRYGLSRSGPIATSPYEVSALLRGPHAEGPDTQLFFTALATDASGLRVADHAGLMAVGYAIAPTSAGEVHVSGPGPHDRPVIAPRYLTTTQERDHAQWLLSTIREILATAPIDDLVEAEVLPGPDVPSSAAAEHVLTAGGGLFHAVGTCASSPTGVTDADLRVRGVEGLRVADLSVLPQHPSGVTMAPAMVLGLLAAERIVGTTPDG